MSHPEPSQSDLLRELEPVVARAATSTAHWVARPGTSASPGSVRPLAPHWW
jgi:hypothetical protein